MPPGSVNHYRVMLYGKDAALLELRAKVLQTAGLVVNIVLDLAVFKDEIAVRGAIYDAIVCCHTVGEEECEEVIAAATQSRIALLKLEPLLLPPPELITRVSSLLRDGPSMNRPLK